jgi:hypothetical protein
VARKPTTVKDVQKHYVKDVVKLDTFKPLFPLEADPALAAGSSSNLRERINT